jgi:hypothetical protein
MKQWAQTVAAFAVKRRNDFGDNDGHRSQAVTPKKAKG